MKPQTMTFPHSLDLSPSVLEVDAARAAFMLRLQDLFDDVEAGRMSAECAVINALSCVWRQGKLYQRDKDTSALMELIEAGIGLRYEYSH